MEKVTKLLEPVSKFLNPLFNYLDSGKLFKQPLMLLYYVIGVALSVYGFVKIVELFDSFSLVEGIYKFYFTLIAIVLLVACAFTLMFWFHRAGDLMKERFEDTHFVAIPVVASLLRTFGEYLGLLLAYLGVTIGALTIVILVFADEGGGKDALKSGLIYIFGGPIVGYLSIVFFRYSAELIMALAAIANNTKDTLEELKKK